MIRRRRPQLLAAAAALALAGCRSVAPALAPLPADDPRPAALLARLAATSAERRALRGSARVEIEGNRRASFSKQIVVLERPARLRLETVGPLGQRVLVLATDGARYDLYRAERAAVESGEVHPGLLLEVAGVPLTPEQAVELALGAPLDPAAGPPPAASAAALPGGGVGVALSARGGELRRSYEFGASGELVRYVVRDASGAPLLEARYGDYRDVGGSAFAHRVEVELARSESRARIEFQWVELNPALGDELFHLELRRTGQWRSSAS